MGGLGYDYLIMTNRFVNWCLKVGKRIYSFQKNKSVKAVKNIFGL
jgi:hypothetical protein